MSISIPYRGIAAIAGAVMITGMGALAVATVPSTASSAATAVPSPSPSGGRVRYDCTEPDASFTRSIPMTVTVDFTGGDLYTVTLTSGPNGLGGLAGTARYPQFHSFLRMTGAQPEGIDMYGGSVDPETNVLSVYGQVALYTPGPDYIHFPGYFSMYPGTESGGRVYLACRSVHSPPPVAVTVGGASPSSATNAG